MSFTASDVEAAVENGDFRSKAWKSEEYYNLDEGDWYELGDGEGKVTLNGVEYDWKSVEHLGGGEGSGEYTAVIFNIGGRLFRKEGYYASHYGTDWDGNFSEVEAYQKTSTAYRPVK